MDVRLLKRVQQTIAIENAARAAINAYFRQTSNAQSELSAAREAILAAGGPRSRAQLSVIKYFTDKTIRPVETIAQYADCLPAEIVAETFPELVQVALISDADFMVQKYGEWRARMGLD